MLGMLEKDVQSAAGKFLSLDSERINDLGSLCTELSALAPYIKGLTVKPVEPQTWAIDSDMLNVIDFIDHLVISRSYRQMEAFGKSIGANRYWVEIPVDGNIKIIGDKPWYTGTYAQDWRPGKDNTGLAEGSTCTIYSPAKFPTNQVHLSGYILTLQDSLKDLSYARLSP